MLTPSGPSPSPGEAFKGSRRQNQQLGRIVPQASPRDAPREANSAGEAVMLIVAKVRAVHEGFAKNVGGYELEPLGEVVLNAEKGAEVSDFVCRTKIEETEQNNS